MIFVAKRITGGGFFKTYYGADVARVNLVDFLTVVSVHQNESADSFLLALGGVVNVRTRFERTRVNSEISEFTYERIGNHLERKTRKRLFVVGLSYFFLVGIGVDTLNVVYVDRTGKIIYNSVEQVLNAPVFITRTAKNGIHLHGKGCFSYRALHFFGGKFARFEEFFH